MTQQDVNRIFTEQVAGLLAQGYQISTSTMSGTQGELAHIDLRKGSEILRVLLEQENDFMVACGEYLSIRVGRHTGAIPDDWRWHDTIWNNRLETLSEIRLAKVTDTYFTSMEEAEVISAKRMARWKSNRYPVKTRALGDAYKSIALRWVQKQPRMKTCRLDEIESVTRVNQTSFAMTLPDLEGYEIKARGKTFKLRPPRG